MPLPVFTEAADVCADTLRHIIKVVHGAILTSHHAHNCECQGSWLEQAAALALVV